ncbi:MAG: serine hydrolase domain-containing protein [Bacteroidota bacterium]
MTRTSRCHLIYRFLILFVFMLPLQVVFSQMQKAPDDALPDRPKEMTLEEKVALILVSADPMSEEASRGGQGMNFWTSDKILNGLEGFQSSQVSVPFPGASVIQRIDNKKLNRQLRKDLLHHASVNGFNGILAPALYLFDFEFNLPGREVRKDHEYALWYFTRGDEEVQEIPAFRFPKQLFDHQESMVFGGRQIKENGFDQVQVSDQSGKEESFEQLVDQGVVFITDHFERDHAQLVRAYENNMLIEEDLDEGCRKLLEILGESRPHPYPVETVSADSSTCFRRAAFEQSVRLFSRDGKPVLPASLAEVDISVVSDVSDDKTSAFREMVNNHSALKTENKEDANYVFWLVGPEKMEDSVLTRRVDEIQDDYPVGQIVLFQAKPGAHFSDHGLPKDVKALVTGASDQPVMWELLAQAAFSGIEIKRAGIEENWSPSLKNLSVKGERNRLKFGVPAEVQMDRDTLARIDELMAEAIADEATPGGQVLVVHKGTVVWHKTYGHHTYSKDRAVRKHDIYDVASVTKIAATMPSLMKLYEQGLWTLEDSLSMYFPRTDTTEKGGIQLKELLLHQSGLPSYIPFYLNTIDRDKLRGNLFSRRYSWQYNIKIDDYTYLNRDVSYRDDVFSPQKDSVFSVPVAQNRFMNESFLDSMQIRILEAPLRTRNEYLYSDLGFYFLGELVPRLSGDRLHVFSDKMFFQPLGAWNTGFLPLNLFEEERIVPTENDKVFRKQLLRGWVHDPNAAMLGGVAGHAGLFSNAADLARILQMYLNKGTYGGKKYLEKNTVELFTKRQNEINRRALGFDKPEPDTLKVNPASQYASMESFGHSGFTGSLVWADPAYDLVYIFLSNRVHPNQYNKTLIQEDYRTRIQDIVYRSLPYLSVDQNLF